MKKHLPIVLAASLLGGAAAAEEPAGCRLGTADDGRTYLLCETRDEVTLERAFGLPAAYDPTIATLVAHESRGREPQPDWVHRLYLGFGVAGRAGDDMNDGVAAVSFGLGLRLTDALRADVTADLAPGRLQVEGGETFAAGRPKSWSLQSALAMATWELPTIGRLTPHLQAGAGVARVETVSWGALPGAATVRETTTGAALGLGAGVSAVIAEGLHLDLGYRFTHLPDTGALGALSLHDVRLGLRMSLM